MNYFTRFIKVLAIGLVLPAFFAGHFTQTKADEAQTGELPPFQNINLSFEERAADLVSRLTLEEKLSLLSETQEAIPRLGMDKYYFGNEALHGVVRPGPFTVFPQAIALASTWDPDLIFEVTTAISDEARGKNNANNGELQCQYCGLLAFWSPTINMARDPRWGRTPETYGEDPFLTGRIAVAFVKGLQGSDPRYLKVVSTPKHFTANNEEHNRMECNAVISERALREYYLSAFRATVTEADAQSVMAAYNAVNGIPCNANKLLLTDILRNEWGFDGYVVSDCGAIGNILSNHKYVKAWKEAAAVALNAGVDLECGPRVMTNNMAAALGSGLVTEEAVNQAAFRVLRARFRLGMFDPRDMVPYWKIPGSVVGSKEHKALALRTALESMVLLKNEKINGKPLLPLNIKDYKTIAVVGPNAAVARFGDYSGSPVNPAVTPLDGIRNKVGTGAEVVHAQWIPAPSQADYVPLSAFENIIAGESLDAGRGFKAEYFASRNLADAPATTRIDAAINIDTLNHPPDPAIPKNAFSVRWTGKLFPQVSGDYGFALTVEGSARMILDGKVLLEQKNYKSPVFRSGQSFNVEQAFLQRQKRISTVVWLEAGKTYDLEVDYFYVDGNALIKLDWLPPSVDKAKAREAEMDLVKNSGLVIAVMGIALEQEREGIDRDDLNLPPDQEEYIKQVLALNPRTVVVLVNGSSLSINWINERAPAVVEAWYGGEQGGNAVADVLFGDYNPSGRLPLTFYKSVNDLPAFDDYEVSRGRTYMYFEGEPIYPFGFGLSYTTFEYGGLTIDKKNVGSDDAVAISLKVTNIGGMDGDEVVQLYVHDIESGVKQPNIMLRGFKRVHIKKGETAAVSFSLVPSRDLSFWDVDSHNFIVEPGAFDILIGASSRDIRLRDKIEVSK